MAADIDFEVVDRSVQQALRILADTTKKSYPQVVKSNGRLIGVNLAYQTQPFGDDSSAKEKGEKAVQRDLKKVFADAPRTYLMLREFDEEMAKAFYKAMLQKNWPEAQRILRSSATSWRNVEVSPFDETLHKKSRNSRGGVSRHVPAQVVTSGARKLDAYTRKKVRLVGWGKAGWAAATMKLSGNTRGIPQFVTRHKNNAPGAARDLTNNPDNPHVILTNNVKYVDTICSQTQIAAALSIQRDKMLAHVDKVTKAAADKFNRS